MLHHAETGTEENRLTQPAGFQGTVREHVPVGENRCVRGDLGGKEKECGHLGSHGKPQKATENGKVTKTDKRDCTKTHVKNSSLRALTEPFLTSLSEE